MVTWMWTCPVLKAAATGHCARVGLQEMCKPADTCTHRECLQPCLVLRWRLRRGAAPCSGHQMHAQPLCATVLRQSSVCGLALRPPTPPTCLVPFPHSLPGFCEALQAAGPCPHASVHVCNLRQAAPDWAGGWAVPVLAQASAPLRPHLAQPPPLSHAFTTSRYSAATSVGPLFACSPW